MFQFATSMLNSLSAIVFGIPLLLFTIALLGTSFTQSDGIKARMEKCSVEDIVDCTAVTIITREAGKQTSETHYEFNFLAQHWEDVSSGYSNCHPLGFPKDLNGVQTHIRKPGAIGLHPPQVPVCSVTMDEASGLVLLPKIQKLKSKSWW